jgi:septal ring factor EnvC (AmiA/AmiB activator)
MRRARKALVIAVVATLGVWGCAKGPAGGYAGADRIKTLEAKNAKLEEDCRVATTASEQLQKRVAALEQQRNQMQHKLEQLQLVTKERDGLRQQVEARTSERDALQVQFEQFRKGIRNLLGQAEASAQGLAPQPVTSADTGPAPGKS